ncbi:S-layer homology domain-containing protein [Paenibacillus sp. GD4]|uniref:S-layer homology domain-containing protein n=1 Tax=Paenibacillus sp. GD4 TaxID=3068890 RepID=UPI002796D9BF|nr:S-layer homology domain-containing protein [Paenibacillus sp. GD4]MDQ1914704.1 S-layer homology domain-containing protein [Paenibacillus sp. GD4]
MRTWLVGFIMGAALTFGSMQAHAAEAGVSLNTVTSAVPGGQLLVKGDTTLDQLVVQVLRPNRTLLWTDVVTQSELREGVSITLPPSLPVGTYTLLAGAGTVQTATAITVATVSSDDSSESPAHPAPPNPPAGPSQDNRVVKDGIKLDAGVPDATGAVKAFITKEMLDTARLASGSTRLKIAISEASGARSYEQVFPAEAFTASAPDGVFEIMTPLGTVHLPQNALEGINMSEASEVSLVVQKGNTDSMPGELRASLTEKPVIDLLIKVNQRPIRWRNERISITVELDYQPLPPEQANPELLTVWYIDDANRIIPVTNGRYDAASGKITFRTKHFSTFAAAYSPRSYRDLSGYEWARTPIEVLAAKGIVQGTASDSYSPERSITRAEFTTLLIRTLELTATAVEPFEDVRPTDYYYEAVGIARKLGISEGLPGNRFEPGRPVSRQEMMTLTARALSLTGKLKKDKDAAELDSFTDARDIAPYARDNVAALTGSGLIEGAGGQLQPHRQATRAEAAVIMYRIYNIQ